MDDIIIIIIVIQNELMGIIQSFIRILLNHYLMIARTIVPPQKKEKEGRRMRNREIVLIFRAEHEKRSAAKQKTACQAKMSIFVYLSLLKALYRV